MTDEKSERIAVDLRSGKIKRNPRWVVVVHCIGSRQEIHHLPHVAAMLEAYSGVV